MFCATPRALGAVPRPCGAWSARRASPPAGSLSFFRNALTLFPLSSRGRPEVGAFPQTIAGIGSWPDVSVGARKSSGPVGLTPAGSTLSAQCDGRPKPVVETPVAIQEGRVAVSMALTDQTPKGRFPSSEPCCADSSRTATGDFKHKVTA